MRVLVVGGTGTVGAPVVEELSRRGHAVRVLSRHGGTPAGGGHAGPVEGVRGDVTSGAGLAEAMDGVDAVVDTTNVPTLDERTATSFFVSGAGHLTAAEAAAGVGHHVLLSIVGIDRVPSGYYRAKIAQERAVAAGAEAGGVRWSILRATQFHEFAAQMIARLRRGPLVPVPLMAMQPVSVLDVAIALADAVETEPGPSGRVPDLAGPEALRCPGWCVPCCGRATSAPSSCHCPCPAPPAGRCAPVRCGRWTERRYGSGRPGSRTTWKPWERSIWAVCGAYPQGRDRADGRAPPLAGGDVELVDGVGGPWDPAGPAPDRRPREHVLPPRGPRLLRHHRALDELRYPAWLTDGFADPRFGPRFERFALGVADRYPWAPNLHYLGARSYEELPAVMAGFDVALMPFALNEATRSISPTKTLEYLAAGLPVVSTPVPDVVADFAGLVHIAAGPASSPPPASARLDEPLEKRDQTLRRIGPRYQWDDIAARIHRIMQDALAASAPGRPTAGRPPG